MMHSNRLIYFGLSGSNKMMIVARTTTMMMMMTTRITVMVIVTMTLTTTTMTKSQARQITSRATMVPRKLKNNRKNFYLSLTLFYSFVTWIIVWLMRIQLSVVFYAIAVTIPVSSSNAECSFYALKRVKTRIRSSMVQERLESLLSMSIKHKILLKCDKERLINLYAGLSPELSKALL